jgi:fibronectin type 3 domain-containing protein
VLNWQDSANTNAAYYAIYRFESKAATQQCQGWGDGHLLDTARKMGNGAEQTFTDSTALKGKTYVYYVTALDRLHNESQANEGVTITVR